MREVKFIHLENLVKAIEEVNQCKMSFKTKLKLRDIEETVKKEVKWFEEQRIELLKKHSKKDENGNPLIENKNYVLDHNEKSLADFDELLNTEFEIKPIEATLVEHLEISGQAWDGLMPIIEKGCD